MNKISVKILLVAVLLLGAIVAFGFKHSSAGTYKFDGVVPFVTPGGLVGFFNQNDGKIYLYDTKLENCALVSQLNELGKPIAVLHKAEKPLGMAGY